MNILDEDVPRQMQRVAFDLKYYDDHKVHELWKDCILYSIVFLDPMSLPISHEIYQEKIQKMQKLIIAKKRQVESARYHVLPISFTAFDEAPYKTQKELATIYSHEVRLFQLRHQCCYKCKGVSILKKYISVQMDPTLLQCESCRYIKIDSFWKYGRDALLPVWYDDNGEVRFDLPDELKGLRLGEQLLIQRLSCFIPIVHIKNGTMGLKGNCVSFRQNISDICNSLPRTKVQAIKIIRTYRDSNSDSSINCRFDLFMVRRNRVLGALKWLKKYHKWYREDPDLIICEYNLDWMNGKEEAMLVDDLSDVCENDFRSEYVSEMHKDCSDNDGTFFVAVKLNICEC